MPKIPRPRKLHSAMLSAMLLGGTVALTGAALAEEPTLDAESFERAKLLYFQQCAGCHGVLRKGATGKSLLPEETRELGQTRLERIIAYGTEGGMNNFDMMYTPEEISLLATYIQMEPPIPPELSLAQMKESTKRFVELEDYPTEPQHDRN